MIYLLATILALLALIGMNCFNDKNLEHEWSEPENADRV